MNAPKNYSQNDEQTHILRALEGTTGRLLDIGAYAPEAFSNNRALIENGWKAVLVEPSPGPFQLLMTAYRDNPNVTLVNVAVTPGPSKLTQWFDSGGDALSTTSEAHKAKWEAGSSVRFIPMWVHMLSIDDLLLQFGLDFDFINIDVESANIGIFRGMPFHRMPKLKVVCIEHDGYTSEVVRTLAPLGFSLVYTNAENAVLTRITPA